MAYGERLIGEELQRQLRPMKHLLDLFIALAVLAAILVSGCSVSPTEVPAGDQETPTRTPLAEEESKTPESAEGTLEPTLPYEARRAVQMAKEDLARRLDLSISEISVISVEAVDWPNTSLGCPQPGMMYAQVITPGYLIVLGAKGQTYQYHSDEGRFVVLCVAQGTPSVPLIPVDKDDIDDGDPWLPAH